MQYTKHEFLCQPDVSTLTVEGDDGLLEGRQKLQALGDETKRALKKNVYENYLKFIDAAKEISSKFSLPKQLHTISMHGQN